MYAYIEAKHSICIQGDGGTSFQKALTQVSQVKILCDRRRSVPLLEKDLVELRDGWPASRNPAYGIVICLYVRLKEGGPILEDNQEILNQLLAAKVMTLLPPDFCIFGKNHLFIPVVQRENESATTMVSPFFKPGKSSMHAALVDGIGFGAGLSLMLWALDWIQLGYMSWPSILEDCIPPTLVPLDE